jgi:hypothetical protein
MSRKRHSWSGATSIVNTITFESLSTYNNLDESLDEIIRLTIVDFHLRSSMDEDDCINGDSLPYPAVSKAELDRDLDNIQRSIRTFRVLGKK